MKILLILPKFHEKTVSRPGDIKIFLPGRKMYMYTFPPFMEAVLREKRQLLNWVGIFQVWDFLGGNFCREFPGRGGEFNGWEFSRWEVFRGKFS